MNLFPWGIQEPEHENNLSLPPHTGTQNEWSFTSNELMVLQDVTLRLLHFLLQSFIWVRLYMFTVVTVM
jgi:hypothetical protein